MSDIVRKLATVRKIVEVKLIEGADFIIAYRVDNWWVVDTVGKYVVGDLVIYIEPDSWVPIDLAPFLSKGKEPREYNGVKGEKLRTIRLRGTWSQGILINLNDLNSVTKIGNSYYINKNSTIVRTEHDNLQNN